MAIGKFGDEAAKSILGEVVAGNAVITAAIQESCNEDFYAPTCTVEDGKLTGEKHGVPFFAQANSLLVVAKEGDEIGLFVVDPRASSIESTALMSTTMEISST